MKTIRLLFWCAAVYSILLVLVRGAIPQESSPTLVLVGIPLIVIAVLVARELAKRSTSPAIIATTSSSPTLREDPVQFLSGQIRVAADASDSYFENVVRARLKDLLTVKVSLERGIERDEARRTLLDPKDGPKLIGSEESYAILYGPVPKSGSSRMEMINDAIRMIEEWQE